MAEQDSSAEDTFLSDVHIEVKAAPVHQGGTVISRFVLHVYEDGVTDHEALDEGGCLDEDGDLQVPRRSHDNKVMFIEHAMSTRLCDVGQQVWRGALAMVDFLSHKREMFGGSVVLELGGGVGLVSIVAAHFCKTVFCTDVGTPILDICQRNTSRNCPAQGQCGEVLVRELDWHSPFMSESKFKWLPSDEKLLREVQYILAADVVYEDKLTESFMQCLIQLNHSKLSRPAVVYVAIEKRINFTLEDLSPAMPAYKHFRACLQRVYHLECGKAIQVEAVPIDLSEIPQYLDYHRVKEIELWKLTTHASARS